MIVKKKRGISSNHFSAAEYLTFITATGESDLLCGECLAYPEDDGFAL